MIPRLAASMKFAGNVFTHRPELVPTYCVPLGYRVFAYAEHGITEIRDDSDAVVFSAWRPRLHSRHG